MSEYISREAAIELLSEPITMSMCLSTEECHHKIAQQRIDRYLIENIPAADVRPVKWIPVTERLPENDTAVLAHVYWPEYGDTMICYGHWHKGWFHLFHHVEGELISGYVVTHWMPLPQPPKEGE